MKLSNIMVSLEDIIAKQEDFTLTANLMDVLRTNITWMCDEEDAENYIFRAEYNTECEESPCVYVRVLSEADYFAGREGYCELIEDTKDFMGEIVGNQGIFTER